MLKIVKLIVLSLTIHKTVNIVYIKDPTLVALYDLLFNLVLVLNFSYILLGSF